MSMRPVFRTLIIVASASLGVVCCVSVTRATDGTSVRHGLSLPRIGSGTARAEVRDTGPFTAIELRDAMDVDITVGNGTRVSVETDDNLLSLIDTRVIGDRLIIDSHGSYNTRSRGIVRIETPSLRAVTLDGSGDVSIDGLRGGTLKLSIAGSGDIRAQGQVDQVDAHIAGSGDLRLGDLDATEAQVRIEGSGDAEVHASESLEATVNGSGDVVYRGRPKRIDRQVNGSGSIHSG